MTDSQWRSFRRRTGRAKASRQRYVKAWCCAGRCRATEALCSSARPAAARSGGRRGDWHRLTHDGVVLPRGERRVAHVARRRSTVHGVAAGAERGRRRWSGQRSHPGPLSRVAGAGGGDAGDGAADREGSSPDGRHLRRPGPAQAGWVRSADHFVVFGPRASRRGWILLAPPARLAPFSRLCILGGGDGEGGG